MQKEPYFLEKLDSEFQCRRRKNSKFSLRAYAKFLDVDPSTLSKVLQKKRPLSIGDALRIGKKLKLSASDYKEFFFSTLHQTDHEMSAVWDQELDFEHHLNELKHFRIIVEWEYYALLNLLKTKNFVPDIAWMSERLGISLLRCQEVWNDLIAAKMVVPDENGVFKRAYSRLATTDYELSLPLQQAHVEELKLVAEKIGQVPPELRDVFSLILPSRPQLLKKARQITRDYFRKMEALLESEPGEEVYLLGAHLIPLTLPKKESNQ